LGSQLKLMEQCRHQTC